MITFACPIATAQTRSGCGARYLRVQAEAVRRTRLAFGIGDPDTCRGCAIGAAHAAGEEPTHWPDGSELTIGSTVPATSHEPPPARSHKRKIPTLDGACDGRTARSWRAA